MRSDKNDERVKNLPRRFFVTCRLPKFHVRQSCVWLRQNITHLAIVLLMAANVYLSDLCRLIEYKCEVTVSYFLP